LRSAKIDISGTITTLPPELSLDTQAIPTLSELSTKGAKPNYPPQDLVAAASASETPPAA